MHKQSKTLATEHSECPIPEILAFKWSKSRTWPNMLVRKLYAHCQRPSSVFVHAQIQYNLWRGWNWSVIITFLLFQM